MNSRMFLITLFILSLLPVVAVGQITYDLPEVGSGPGFKTTFIMFNNSSNPASVVISLTDTSGAAMALELAGLGEASNHLIELGPGETRFLETVDTEDFRVGAARVTSTIEIGISAIFSIFDGLTEAGIGASPLVTEAAIPVDTVAPFNTGIAIRASSSADITFKLFDEAGNQVGDSVSRQIGSSGQLATFVAGPGGLFPDRTDFRGRMVISSSATFAALTLRQGSGGAPLTTMPAVSTSSSQTSFALPQIANGAEVIRIQIIVFNLSSQANEVDLSFTQDNGSPMNLSFTNGQSGSQFDLDVPGNGAIFLETDGLGDLVVGAARLESTVPVGVTAVFSLLNPDGSVSTEAGVGDSAGQTEFTIPVDLTAGFNTGVAIQNLGSGPATVEFSYFDSAGNPQGNSIQYRSETVPAGGHLSKNVGELVDNASGQGQLGVSSNEPLAAITLRQKGFENLTTLPVAEGVFDSGGSSGDPANLLPKMVQNLNLTSDVTNFDVSLDGGFKISGILNQPSGLFPIAGIRAVDSSGRNYQGFVNFFTGGYEVVVPKGTVELQTCLVDFAALSSSGSVPSQLPADSLVFIGHREQGVQVTGDTVRNITIPPPPTTSLTGTISNLDRLPPGSDAIVAFTTEGETSTTSEALAEIQPDGSFATEAAPGNYTASIILLDGEDTDNDGIPDDFNSVSVLYDIEPGGIQVAEGVTPSAVASLSVPDLATVSGTITQPDNPVLPKETSAMSRDTRIPDDLIIQQCYPLVGVGFQTTSTGDYSLPVISGRNYDFSALVPTIQSGTQYFGQFIAPPPGTDTRQITADTIIDLNLPAFPEEITVSGRVTDSVGNPIQGVTVIAVNVGGLTNTPETVFDSTTMTDASGNYTLTVFSGSGYFLEFLPPLDTGLPFP